ncbi:DNA repair helicase rad25 [Hesseltinella vesiculosa]|uniref:DNA 3'-5' helicase n=1 Tax=Hesseltinella vesiculosa TaxID=101127 RepID=A0A1X2GEY7_9FUNG|nr:DNA repair helicase rad25 [Hesseltinella vesiculosa]
MVLGKLENTSPEKRQQHLSNLLSLVQQRSQEQKRRKLENDLQAEIPQEDENNNDSYLKTKNQMPRIAPKAVQASAPADCLPPYDFKNDTNMATLPCELRPEIEPRPYQLEALASVLIPPSSDEKAVASSPLTMKSLFQERSVAQSGIIVLPCGAGKTLTSILVACAIQQPVLVVCSTVIAAMQFQKEFLRFTNIMASRMGMFAGSKKWPFNGPSGVLFTTYTMLMDHRNRTADSKRMAQFIDKTNWGLVIFDEVHCGPAANYSRAMTKIHAKVRLGLTATLLREDEKIGDLEVIVGPVLYQAKWKELAERGYIAKVICTQVETEMTPVIRQAYEDQDAKEQGGPASSVLGVRHHLKSLLCILNPKKMQVCQRLIQYHEAKGDKVLVYCDHIDALKLYAQKMNRPFIYGGTPTTEAQMLLQRFQIDVSQIIKQQQASDQQPTWAQLTRLRKERAQQIDTLFLSRIGDTSLDLPAATVLIQVSSHFGSRRQEAQRLGRVLRAKKRHEKGFYSRFYTLVSTDTHEVTFSGRRRQFLEEECGYGYQIWCVGDQQTPETGEQSEDLDDPKHYGWQIEPMPNTTTPLDDEIKLDPLTCHLQTSDPRPYDTTDTQQQLVTDILALKNIQVEPDSDMDDLPSASTPTPSTPKRKRNAN